MAFSAEELEAGQRLGLFNANKVGPNNRYGLGQGGQRNFVLAAQDLSLFGAAVVRETGAMLAAANELADLMGLAALVIEGGPVSSVRVGDGPAQTGAVRINLDSLSAAINEQIAQVRAAQATLEARAASGQAFSLAFGD